MFGRIFGTEKAIDNLMDKDSGLLAKAGSWVGGLNYSEQEKAENALAVREWGLKQLEALAPFKVVQRILAFGISFIWATVALNILLSIWVKAMTCSYKDIISKTGEVTTMQTQTGCVDAATQLFSFAFSDFIFWPATVCYGLYFGGGFVESIIRTRKEK